MKPSPWLKQQLHLRSHFAVRFLSFLVAAHGVYILATTLLAQIGLRHGVHLSRVLIDLPLLLGLSLIYLGTLLRRRKRAAWLVTVMAYTFYLGLSVSQLFGRMRLDTIRWHEFVGVILVPLVVLLLLVAFQREFVVKSDIQGFRFAARFAVVILLATVIYGVAGFLLLDRSDFHQEISVYTAVHYTVDQFDLTTARPLVAYSHRAHLFLDSLSFVSFATVVYVAGSLFQPLRTRLSSHEADRQKVRDLLERYGGPSEEFFKLWPHDKQYFFDSSGRSALAFRVSRGVALCLGDPVGGRQQYPALLWEFDNLCFSNDWTPAYVYTNERYHGLYERQGYMLQKLGQEAVVELAHFQDAVVGQKYFRQINNKFTKQGYSCELLSPPHHQAVLERLQVVSEDWLGVNGRTERGFVMGYHDDAYLQQCRLMVLRDAAGTIQAFANLVPAGFDRREATYDLLRQTKASLSNSIDFLLINLIAQLQTDGYEYLNLGLCPLAGLEEADEEQNRFIDSFLRFAYVNGDRFYSFNGLYRFKAKYEPEWRDRYLGYRGGVQGFTKVMTALMRSMKV